MKTLFNEFQSSTAAEWKERLAKDLKGITFDDLSVTDRNGINIHPFYTAEDIKGLSPVTTGRAEWFICERIEVGNEETANKQALAALNKGASGIIFEIKNTIDLNTLLKGIELPYIYTCFETTECAAFTQQLNTFLRSENIEQSAENCFVSDDVVSKKISGSLLDFDEELNAVLQSIAFNGHLCIDATIYQNAGTNSITELGFLLAQLNEYLNLLQDNPLAADLRKIHLSLAVDCNFYEQIAKLRACRKLVAFLLSQYNIDLPLHLHVETSDIYRSPFDSYSNLLRDTIAGMAAVIGGCDSLNIHPFDGACNTGANDFSQRMSRNQQLIFKEESYLDKVADASEGSYYIEQLTEDISTRAWEIFKETEQQGGLSAAYDKGIIKATIEKQAAELITAYKEGKKTLIGVNKFPNAADMPRPGVKKEGKREGIHPISLTNALI